MDDRVSTGMDSGRDGSTSRRWFLCAAGLTTASIVVGCSRKSNAPSEGEGATGEASPEPEPEPIPGLPTVEPVVRVRLGSMDARDEPVEIGPPGAWLRIGDPEPDQTLAVLRGPVRVNRRDGAWSVVDARGFSPWTSESSTLRISPLRDAEPVSMVDGKAYPGYVQVHAGLDGDADAFDLVNHVPLEPYLPGVLVRELYNHWHIETHTAQAIAARTFAIAESVFWKRRRHFDVTNTQASQVYDGLTTHESSLEAVRATRGVVLAYHDKLVPGYYSSSCGGLAARAVDAIGTNPINDVPPLYGAAGEDACASLELQRWNVTHGNKMLAERMAAFGQAYNDNALAAIEHVDSVELSATNEHGRPTRFAIHTGGYKPIEMRAEALRWAANFTDAPLSAKERLLSSFVDPQTSRSRITFHGRGRGHGAGLCQYGAEMMARGGSGAMEILTRYYPGVEIVGSYG